VINADLGQCGQGGLQVWQVAGVEVELGVPAGDLVDPSGKVSEVVECLPTTAEEIEPHRAHPGAGEGLNLPGRGRGWELGDADETGPETVKGIEQVGLVETWKEPDTTAPPTTFRCFVRLR